MAYGISSFPTTFMIDKEGKRVRICQRTVKRGYDAKHYPADGGREKRIEKFCRKNSIVMVWLFFCVRILSVNRK